MLYGKELQHISFDLWLTLIKSHPEFKPLRNQLLCNHFGIRQSPATIAHTVTRYDRLFNQVNELTGRNIHYSEMILVILDALEVDVAAINRKQMDCYYNEMEMLMLAYPPQLIDQDTHNILEHLKNQGYSLNITSNTGFILGSSLRKLLKALHLDAYFDFQLYSDETNCSKPSIQMFSQVYQEACKSKMVTKEQVLHVGDNSIADVKGATDFGFRAILVDNNTNTLSKIFLN